jgi:multidrug resistance efflux pump
VAAGAALVELDSTETRAEVAAAEARIAQAEAELEPLTQGGRPADLTEIDNALARARQELSVAQKELGALERLLARSAATAHDVTEARNRAEQAQLQISSLEKRRAALVSASDRAAAEARLSDARAAAELARANLSRGTLRAPIAGVVYNLPAKMGAFLEAGTVAASVGEIEKLRVKVYVDEPELGRVGPGMPVTITWDAMPGRQWTGQVDRAATQVIALGTRQVGEVICRIDNPKGELLPGTNVNARIRSQVVEQALTIPKEALRRLGGVTGVYLLRDGRVTWKPVEAGISSVTRVQIRGGLSEGDSVALSTEQTLASGVEVKPVYP